MLTNFIRSARYGYFDGGLLLRLLPDGTLGTVLGHPPAVPGPLPCPAPPRGAVAGRVAA